jgi:hypothetical protein
MTRFEIRDADLYRSEYGRLASALGVPNASPAPGEVEFLSEATTPGRFPFAMMPGPDIFFMGAVASLLRPRLAIEIGTASGFSAAVLAKVIALRWQQTGALPAGVLVHTIDLKAEDRRALIRPVGFAVDLIAPELREHIAVHPLQDSSYGRHLVRAGGLTLAFIDGNHQHPWPLSDVLQMQCLMENGWILLHDIDLPALAGNAPASGQRGVYAPRSGAKHVFDFWPGEKIGAGNIGAIEIPHDRRSLGAFVAKLRELPSEVSPNGWKRRWREIDALEKKLHKRIR